MEQTTEMMPVLFSPTGIERVQPLKLKLSAITEVKNDKQLEVAQILIKEGKALFKEIEAQRKGFTVKLDNIKAQAMAHEKEVLTFLGPVEPLISAYLKKKEQDRMAEQRRIEEDARLKAETAAKVEKQKQNLINFELNTKKEIDELKKFKDLDVAREKLLAYKPSEDTFGVNVEQAKTLRKDLLKLFDKKREAIKDKKELEIDISEVESRQVEQEIQGMEKLQNIDIEAQAKTQSLGITSGIKKVWKFEVEQITNVPAEYLIVDQVKINAAIRAGARNISGLKIFQDIERSGR